MKKYAQHFRSEFTLESMNVLLKQNTHKNLREIGEIRMIRDVDQHETDF